MDERHSSTISGPGLSWILFSIFALSLVARPQTPGDFTIAVLPDTQNYSQFYPQIFDAQTQWIANNAGALNLQLVIGLGDIVNVGTDPAQWANATHSVGILDQAGVPYALAIGNHDYDTLPPTSRSATNFNKYFGPSRYANASYYGASTFPPGSNENFYETFNWQGNKYLILVLEFVPRKAALAWARSVLDANLDKEVIVVTHSYLYSDNTTVDECDTSDMIADNNGASQWANLLEQYPNLSVVLSGHVTNKFNARRSDVAAAGNFVHQMFANWQTWTNGGNGYLRIMQFSPQSNSITVTTYSPFTGQFLTDAGNQFTLKWHNDGTPGTGTAVVSGRVRTASYGKSCAAIAGATVNIGGATVLTDSTGTYSLALPPGTMSATANAAGFLPATQNLKLNDYFPNQVDFFLTAVPPCPTNLTDPSVTICTPANNATVSSPANVIAGSNSSVPIVSLSIWLDGRKVYSTTSSVLNTDLTIPSGTHFLTVQAINGANQVANQKITLTVPFAVQPPCTPGNIDLTVTICSPAPSSVVTSPVNIVAGSTDNTASVVNMFVWIDGTKQWTAVGNTLNASLPMSPGTRRVTVQAKDSWGRYFQSTEYITVH
jgi:hypothetical protein